MKQKGFAAVAPLVPHLVRRMVEQAGAERHAAELDELAGERCGAWRLAGGGARHLPRLGRMCTGVGCSVETQYVELASADTRLIALST